MDKVSSLIAGSIRCAKEKYVGGVSYHLYRRGIQTADGFDNYLMSIAVTNDELLDGWVATSLSGERMGKGSGYADIAAFLKYHGALAAWIDSDGGVWDGVKFNANDARGAPCTSI